MSAFDRHFSLVTIETGKYAAIQNYCDTYKKQILCHFSLFDFKFIFNIDLIIPIKYFSYYYLAISKYSSPLNRMLFSASFPDSIIKAAEYCNF